MIDRYRTDQELDDKSGYRLACRPIAMVEAQIAELVHRCGGQPVHLIVDHGLRVGVPAAESLRALVRLVAAKALHYDVAIDLVTKVAPPLPWWKRLARWCIARPGCWLIACVVLTTGFCIAFT